MFRLLLNEASKVKLMYLCSWLSPLGKRDWLRLWEKEGEAAKNWQGLWDLYFTISYRYLKLYKASCHSIP